MGAAFVALSFAACPTSGCGCVFCVVIAALLSISFVKLMSFLSGSASFLVVGY